MAAESSWKKYLREYEGIASSLGLEPKETVYEEVEQGLIRRFVAQGIPFAPQYWNRGREYLRTSNSSSVYYEIVFNLDPARAYISREYEDPIKSLTVAHVMGHSHVFNKSPFETSRTYSDVALESYVERVHEYEQVYGPYLVEKAIDLAFALNPTSFNRKTKKKLDLESSKERGVSTSEVVLVESSLGVSLDYLKRVYLSEGEAGLKNRGLENLCQERGFSFSSVVDLIKRYLVSSSPYSLDRDRLQVNLLDGEEDLIHFFSNEVDFFPDWVRDILRMEGLIYRLTHSDIPLSIVHEGFATWTHLKVFNLSSVPDSWKIESVRFTSRLAVPFFVNVEEYKIPIPGTSGRFDLFARFHMTVNPYGFGLIVMNYLESKGKHLPTFVSSVSDYSLFDYLGEDFFFSFLPKFIGGTREQNHHVYSDKGTSGMRHIPASGLHENFYAILSDTHRLIKEEGEREVDTYVAYEYLDGYVSEYYLLLYSLAKYMLSTGIESPYEAIVRMFRSGYGFSLPRVSVYTNPRSNRKVESIFLYQSEGSKYTAFRSTVPSSNSYSNPLSSITEVKELKDIPLSSAYDSLIFLSDSPLDPNFASEVCSLVSMFVSLGSIGRSRPVFRDVIVLSPKEEE